MIPALVQARRNAKVPLRLSTKSPRKKHCPGFKTPKRRNSDAEDPRRDLQMFHEYDLWTEIQHPVSGIPYVFTGRADWAAGHSGRGISDPGPYCSDGEEEADQPTEDLDSYVLRKRFYSYSKTGMPKS